MSSGKDAFTVNVGNVFSMHGVQLVSELRGVRMTQERATEQLVTAFKQSNQELVAANAKNTAIQYEQLNKRLDRFNNVVESLYTHKPNQYDKSPFSVSDTKAHLANAHYRPAMGDNNSSVLISGMRASIFKVELLNSEDVTLPLIKYMKTSAIRDNLLTVMMHEETKKHLASMDENLHHLATMGAGLRNAFVVFFRNILHHPGLVALNGLAEIIKGFGKFVLVPFISTLGKSVYSILFGKWKSPTDKLDSIDASIKKQTDFIMNGKVSGNKRDFIDKFLDRGIIGSVVLGIGETVLAAAGISENNAQRREDRKAGLLTKEETEYKKFLIEKERLIFETGSADSLAIRDRKGNVKKSVEEIEGKLAKKALESVENTYGVMSWLSDRIYDNTVDRYGRKSAIDSQSDTFGKFDKENESALEWKSQQAHEKAYGSFVEYGHSESKPLFVSVVDGSVVIDGDFYEHTDKPSKVFVVNQCCDGQSLVETLKQERREVIEDKQSAVDTQ
jgi:hypothetical protein